MKKIVVLLITALVICAGISASDIQIGVMQNLINTSILLDAEMDHFGFETSVGLPVVPLTISGIEALFKGNGDEDSESSAIARGEGDEEESDNMGFVVPAGAMANIYFKVYSGSKFSKGLLLSLMQG